MRCCFLQLGKTYATTKRRLGIPKYLVEHASLSFCCRELICNSEVRASRSCPINYITEIQSQAFCRVDLQATKKIEHMQCHSRGLVNSAQHFPTSYECTHACTHAILGLSSNTWHKRMPHDSPFLSSVGHSVAHASRQR